MLTVLLSEQKVKILYKQILYRQIYHLSSILFKYGVQPHYTWNGIFDLFYQFYFVDHNMISKCSYLYNRIEKISI